MNKDGRFSLTGRPQLSHRHIETSTVYLRESNHVAASICGLLIRPTSGCLLRVVRECYWQTHPEWHYSARSLRTAQGPSPDSTGPERAPRHKQNFIHSQRVNLITSYTSRYQNPCPAEETIFKDKYRPPLTNFPCPSPSAPLPASSMLKLF
jgi:hypothetical protein